MNPLSRFDLEEMRRVDIRTVDVTTLTDINTIDINPELPFLQKVLEYLSQTENAYCFRCGDVAVKISHSQTTTSLKDCMEGFFQTL